MRKSLRIVTRVMLIGGVSLVATQVQAQLKVGKNPTSIQKSAILELESDKQGLLLPRVADTTLMTALNPPDGMIIYWTAAGTEGFYVRHNYKWEKMATKASSWDLLGNAIADATTQFIGTTNNIPFVMRGNNKEGLRVDDGNVIVKNDLTLSGITAGGSTLMDAVIVDGTGKVFKRTLTAAALSDFMINGSAKLDQKINTDNAAGDYKFTTSTTGATTTHQLSIATQTGAAGGPAVGLLTNADWNKFNTAAGKALQIANFIDAADAKGLTIGTDASNNPTIALNAATEFTPGGVNFGTQTFGGAKTFAGKITGKNGLDVTAGGANITGVTNITGATNITGLTTITGNTEAGGTLHVTGTSTLDNKLTITTGGADVTGNTKVTGDLNVTGKSILDNTVTLNSTAVGNNTNHTVLLLNASKEVITRDLPESVFTDLTFGSDHTGTDLKVVKDATNKVTVSIPQADPSVIGGLVSNASQSFAGDKRFANDVSVQKNVKIGDTTSLANSTLQVAGSVSMAIKEIASGPYNIDATDYTVVVKSGSAVIVNLPTAAGAKGRIYTIKKAAFDVSNNLNNTVTVKAQAGQFVEDGNSIDIYNDWTFITVQSNGTDTWYIIKK
ncbi:hypothetical protein ACTJJ0_04145 [Chitinophaga sp. 22321]|uniref:Autotransporter-associated beta strand repeat-containing protein n=1 Tax=Chitinophaga hostae TaxID=2831022 RepID=A0ABS5IXY1_9BACT|nr:hypothetical protein [Chitinophaga hostae]MBS0027832.1 hypothetical protein [Chitinophaga hostae]